MTFATWALADLVAIASNGGGLDMDAKSRTTTDLVMIASTASGKDAKCVFRGLTTRALADLVMIAAAGKGCVMFVD
jgi:hypothetical protein